MISATEAVAGLQQRILETFQAKPKDEERYNFQRAAFASTVNVTDFGQVKERESFVNDYVLKKSLLFQSLTLI